jgi:tripartite ATP-independent transporter DctP family solute receptor
MKRTTRYLKFFLAVALCFSVLAALTVSVEAANFKKEYKIQINVGPQFYWGMGAQKFADLVKQRTGGQINIKPYWGSSLLKGAQLKSAQLVANGVIDCAMESTINISPVITEANIFSLPFFINNFENLDKMEYGQTGKAIFEAMDAKGLVGLAWAENGFRQVTNSKLAIRTPADVKGLRLRVVGSPIFIDTFRQLGADPVNMNWGDAVTAFGQGVVDGQENPVGVLVPVQIWQYHKYATFWNYLVDPVVFYWNKKQWNAFPKDIQKILKESAEEAAMFEKALCRAGLDGQKSLDLLKNKFNYTMKVPEPVKFMESKGMTVTFLSDEERNAFITATKPLYEKWVPKIGKELYNKALSDMGK